MSNLPDIYKWKGIYYRERFRNEKLRENNRNLSKKVKELNDYINILSNKEREREIKRINKKNYGSYRKN